MDAEARGDGQERPRGSPLVVGLAAGQWVSWGSLIYSFPLFIQPMERDLGWSRVDIDGALSLGLLISGLCAFPLGRWIDRRGGRGIMSLGSIGAALLLLLWAHAASLAVFYACWALLGCVLAAVLSEAAFAVLVRAYGRDARRAIVALTVIGGFASTIFVPFSSWLIGLVGWRGALEGLAAANLLAAGVHMLVLRRTPRAGGSAPIGTAASGSGRSLVGAAVRTRPFWGLAVCFVAYNALFSALNVHLIPLLTDRGVSLAWVVKCVAIGGFAQVLGRVAVFLLGNTRARAGLIGPIGLGLLMASTTLLLTVPARAPLLLVYAVAFGFGNGFVSIVRGTAVAELIGPQGYGEVNGALTLPANAARAAAPVAVAWLWSWSGRYGTVVSVLIMLAVLSALGFLLALIASPRRAMDAR
jgi:MFS family permease